MDPTCAIKLSVLMETISVLSGTATLSMPWLEELELNRVEGSTQYGKVRKLTAEQSTVFSHISSWISLSSLCIREHTIPPPPHGSQDKALGRRVREHDTS